MKKYAQDKAFKLTIPKHDLIKKHAEKVENADFKSEVSSYLYFYDFIKEILGYDREENILFDEKEDKGRGKSEFALKSGDKKFMVIELKNQTSDLDKPQNRVNDKRTPVDQAFDYAQHTGDINWILVSNFKEFRLYNWGKKSDNYICFTYEDLLDQEKFTYFMLAFSKTSHIEKDYPKKLLKDTLVIEKQLETNFYKLFHETRLMLIKELEEFNELNRVDAVHYAQLILNRYMFISFAEDTGLLTSQISTDTIVTPIKKGNLRQGSIWQRLNELFLDINDGNKYKNIPAYNGGLFEKDLEFIKIRDVVEDQELFKDVWQDYNFGLYEKDIQHLLEPYSDEVNPIYKNLLTISSFDFSSELDVNILGHIFENSIGDLEVLKADIKGRRKKEGIFYTPSFITDYICRNTIIPYLSKSGKINSVDELLSEYWGSAIQKLDQKVKKIKIVDPACGSGAFLSKAADVLVEIHRLIHEELYKDKKSTLRPYFDPVDMRREILLNNIYGVDLNEESVEITKLSLFLKVCQKDKKLPALDENIKCGNSLIDDPEYAGDKAFNWEEEFSDIFKEGGFDVVLGNPPYIRVQNLSGKETNYYKKTYESAYKRIDISVLFIELANQILNLNGVNSFITSNQFLTTEYGRKARKFILENCSIKKIVDYGDLPVFEDALTYVSIFVFGKGETEKFQYYKIPSLTTDLEQIKPIEIISHNLGEESWLLEKSQFLDIINKLKIHPSLAEGMGKCWYGIVSGSDKVFIFNADDLQNIPIEKEALLPLIRAQNCGRYEFSSFSKYVIYPYKSVNGKTILLSEDEIKNDYPKLYNFLLNNKGTLTKRKDSRKTFSNKKNWYSLTRFGRVNIFERNKIIFPGETKKNKFGLDISGAGYSGARVFSVTSENPKISIKYLLSIFNSLLIERYLHSIAPLKQGGYYSYSSSYIDKLPIPKINLESQKPFIKKTDEMLNFNQQIQDEVKGFHDWLRHTFNIEKLSQKLEKYYNLELDVFLDEVRKKKVDLKSRKNYQTLKKEYEESLVVIKPLLQQIKETDAEIDRMVYELYGLTEEEIQIIEENVT